MSEILANLYKKIIVIFGCLGSKIWFMQDSGLFRVRFRQKSLKIPKE